MRTFKTAFAVFLCLIIYHLWGRGGYFLAATASIICMQDSLRQSYESAICRILGTAIGAFLGTALLYLNLVFPRYNLMPLTATLGIIVLITLCNLLKQPDAIVISCVVFLFIVLEQSDLSPFIYGATRLLDTFIGIIIAILVNRFIRNPDTRIPDPEPEVDSLCEIPGQTSIPGIIDSDNEKQ